MTKQNNSAPVSPAAVQTLEQIITFLPKMSQTDLRAAASVIDKELALRSDLDMNLIHIMLDAFDQKKTSLGAFALSPNGTLWCKNIPHLYDLVSKLTEGKRVTQTVMNAIHQNLFQLLSEYLKGKGIPPTLKTVCHEVANIQAIFETNFPGYLQSQNGRNLYLFGLGAFNEEPQQQRGKVSQS